jgi:glycosyltransferase involved in cell wall biosynthesis
MADLAVLMSVYKNDRLDFLKESVLSILNQTDSDFHYYLILDGPVSEDIAGYISTLDDQRIKIYRFETNKGLAVALNYLLAIILRNPDYRFIARMDADDISEPARFEKQRRYLQENPGITILGSWYEEINESGAHLSYRKLPTDHESLRKRYFTRTPFAHPSVMFKRDLIEVAGYYPTDTTLMEDNVLWGRALKSGLKFANLPEYLLKFRITEDFYKRRSGIKYGWNYIVAKFTISRDLDPSFRAYLYFIFIGAVRMMPSFIIRSIYSGLRRYFG